MNIVLGGVSVFINGILGRMVLYKCCNQGARNSLFSRMRDKDGWLAEKAEARDLARLKHSIPRADAHRPAEHAHAQIPTFLSLYYYPGMIIEPTFLSRSSKISTITGPSH